MASVRVAVRVRPLNKREKQLSSKVMIQMKGNTISIDRASPVPGDELADRRKAFSYDFSYDSTDRGSPSFASQERIFQDLGSDVLKAAFEGLNACVFAYGQTGSGKSYTMMGNTNDKGLIPRVCEGLFCESSQRGKSDAVSFCTKVSYMEIYNERVQDLLIKRAAPTDGGGLRVREHPVNGPYVENLSKHLVHNCNDMEDLIMLGNANRTTASTGMNNFSSRSHAILTVYVTQAWFDAELPREMLSKIHLVDLAGSERADATRSTGTRLKEGANINKSLVTLGSVISALADLSVGGQSIKKKKQIFIPYRDSVLTWLLKDSLGGNSVTTMIATISPADVNYSETLSTLRYASRAKNIVNSPTVNEDGSVKVIRELQAEVTRLRELLEEASQASCGELPASVKVEEELHQNEEKVLALTKEWSSKWGETRSILQEETVALRKEGSGVVLDCQMPHLIGIDLLTTGMILYYLKEGRTLIGGDEASCSQDIVLHGQGLLTEHCALENRAGTVTLIPQDGALCSVNGSVVTDPCQLTRGAIIQLGGGTILRFNQPTEAAQLREKGQARPGKYPVPDASCELDGDTPQGGVSTRDGQEQERGSCHKSGPRLMSDGLLRKAQSGAGVPSYRGEEVWSGDASLKQTNVLGPGDGCGRKPEGNANEIQGVVADCYKGRPDSGGSSLGSMSHLQSSGGTSFTSVLPQTSTHSHLDKKHLRWTNDCPRAEKTTSEGQIGCGEMGGLEETSGAVQNSVLSSLVSRVSYIVQDAGRLLWSSSTVLQQVREEGLQPVGARWSSHVISLVRESNVLSVVKDSQAFSMVKGSFVFSLLKDSHMLSLVKELPLIQHIQMEITRNLQPKETAQIIQGYIQPEATQLPVLTLTQTFNKGTELAVDMTLIPEDNWTRNKSVPDLQLQKQDVSGLYVRQGDKLITEPVTDICEPAVNQAPAEKDQASENSRAPQDKITDVPIAIQTLIEFPESLLNLQNMSLRDLMDNLQSLYGTSLHTSQKIVALYWLEVAKCSQPEPRPALLILVETGLYTFTSDSGVLVLSHHLPWLHLKEVQIGLAGHSLRLMGTKEESITGVYTYSQKLTKELCRVILGVIHPGDSRISQHPLLHGDLVRMSLDWETYVPDLLLDAGLRVCCQFQRSLADLVWLLHCNMDQAKVSLGDVKVLLYTCVGVCLGCSIRTEPLAQFFLTDTHLGLVQEDAVCNRATSSAPVAPCRPQFYDLTLRQRSDVRCVLVRDEDQRGAVRLDVILANVRGRGHPESVTKATTTPEHSSNSSPHAEVWKLTFSCSSEAACLINHLSNV